MAIMRDEELQKARQIIETLLREHIESARFDKVALRLGFDADGDVIFAMAIFDDEEEKRLETDETLQVILPL